MVVLKMMCFPPIVKGETGELVNTEKIRMYKGGK